MKPSVAVRRLEVALFRRGETLTGLIGLVLVEVALLALDLLIPAVREVVSEANTRVVSLALIKGAC